MLIKNVFKLFVVSYEWVEARDGQFGLEDEFGNWSGLVGELHNKVTVQYDFPLLPIRTKLIGKWRSVAGYLRCLFAVVRYLTPISCVENKLSFSYFEFDIRLIRLGLSFQKTKIPVFELTTYWFSTITPNSQLWVGDTEKFPVTFSHAKLVLVEFT